MNKLYYSFGILSFVLFCFCSCQQKSNNTLDSDQIERSDKMDTLVSKKQEVKKLEEVADPKNEEYSFDYFVDFDSIPEDYQRKISIAFGNFKKAIESENMDEILKHVHFPLKGEWGFVMGYRRNGIELNAKHFVERFNMVFTEDIRRKILATLVQDVEVLKHTSSDKVMYTFQFDLAFDNESGFESSRHFTFCWIDNKYVLCQIWHAG